MAVVIGEIDYEAEYNNRARVPEHPALIAGWARDAQAWREQQRFHTISYGPRGAGPRTPPFPPLPPRPPPPPHHRHVSVAWRGRPRGFHPWRLLAGAGR